MRAAKAVSSPILVRKERNYETNSAVARSTLFILLFMMQPASIAFAYDVASVDGPLACQIEYRSVVRDDVRNDDGWLLAWKAKVRGDLEGELAS
jgi:hypothetical protein